MNDDDKNRRLGSDAARYQEFGASSVSDGGNGKGDHAIIMLSDGGHEHSEGMVFEEEDLDLTRDARLGRAVRQYKEVKIRLNNLNAEAKKLGDSLIALGNALREHPEGIVFEGEPYNPRIVPNYCLIECLVSRDLLGEERVRMLAKNCREMIRRLDELAMQLQAMGLQEFRGWQRSRQSES